MSQDYGNYIGGEWVAAASGETFENINPADRSDVIGRFPRSGAADVDRAVTAAKKALRDWMLTPAPERADYILRVGLMLEERKEELMEVMTREMGKTLKESGGDIQEGIDFAFYMAGEGRRMFGETMPSELRSKFYMTVRHPIGVVGLITPWNFPIAIPTWKSFAALVAGCTLVLKPGEDVPHCASLLLEMFHQAGLPSGVFNLVHGFGEEAGAPLVDHPDVAGISFTGSLEIGRMINEKCARQMKRCSLELGSKNAQIVMPDAQMDVAVEGAAWGAFATSGQRCTATSRLLVHREVHDEFTDRLLERVETMKVGSGLDPEVELAPVINEKQKNRILEYIQIGRQEGAKVLTGGDELTGEGYEGGFFVQPTVFDDVSAEMRIAQEEIFGPVTGIIPISSVDEAIDIANSVDYGLSCSMYTHDITNVFRAVQEIEFGLIYVNAPTIGAEIQVPFGGLKNTGNGHREAGPVALDFFTEWKTIAVDFSGKLQKAQIED